MSSVRDEIGSEFELDDTFVSDSGNALSGTDREYALTFSGRIAIETALQDFGRSGKAMLPSYCCESMITPFRKAGFAVGFYTVSFDGSLTMDFEAAADCDVFLYCNYFGFRHIRYPEALAEAIHRRGGVILEDMTHSLLSENPVCAHSDYYIASLRKWFPLYSGGICVKKEGKLRQKPQQQPDDDVLLEKHSAMQQKKDYLAGADGIDKQHFLKQFGSYNTWLAAHDSGFAMDTASVKLLQRLDFDAIKQRRIENARVLYQGLRNQERFQPLFAEEEMQCPLFFPIRIPADQRAAVRKKLTDAMIYCPIHWPKPQTGGSSALFDTELSLVCDQRYTAKDMQRIIGILSDIRTEA